MIGLVGPRESVQAVWSTAAEMGYEDLLLAEPYSRIEDSGLVAYRLMPICQCILFTGRMAYTIARGTHRFGKPTTYVDHTVADFTRALHLATQRFDGLVPELSVDLFERDVLEEACQDLDITLPSVVRRVHTDPMSNQDTLIHSIFQFHHTAWKERRVQICLTTFFQVHRALLSAGTPTIRVTHTRSSIRRALQRAKTIIDIGRAESTQLIIGLVHDQRSSMLEPDGGQFATAVKHIAELLRGSCVKLDASTQMIHATFGSLQDTLQLDGAHVLLAPIAPHGILGFGTGTTVSGAEDNARQALQLAKGASRGHAEPSVFLVTADGTAQELVRKSTLSLREIRPELLELSRLLGLGVPLVHRLVATLARFGSQLIGARDLALSLGVSDRTARRILSSLRELGIAIQSGRSQGPGVGRPQKLYEINNQELARIYSEAKQPLTDFRIGSR